VRNIADSLEAIVFLERGWHGRLTIAKWCATL
jgi:hypothetical protein